ncbi:hypothetical protein F5Y04DRAFT_154080 [Hypomontagnella monticulosa]|nr:hypothetical protein F5Y04DRAFT_154080 [Hypomontagnella monticulosa]
MVTMFESFFRRDIKRDLRPAALGVDLGSSTSKAALAFKASSNMHSRETIQVLRVRLPQDRNHPDTPQNPSVSQFEFIAQAAREGSRLIPGRQALNKDLSWSIKAILMHLAGVSIQAIKRMPGGNDLLSACQDGTITREMEEDALRKHLELVRDMAIDKAQAGSLKIEKVVLTYPNYLCERERDRDFEHYTSYYLTLMRSLWEDDVQLYTTMEGMSLALYVCEPFEDGLASCNWPEVWRDFGEWHKDSYVNVMVVDMGGSTLNLQLLGLFFDAKNNGKMLNCQSSFDPDWKLGALGGSQLPNAAIKEIVRRELSKKPDAVSPDEFARLMYRFEECKWTVDYRNHEKKITLTGNDERFRVKVRPQELKEAFQCFDKPTEIFKKELRRVLNIGNDFVVVFAGGSFSQPGLRCMMDDYMTGFEADAKKDSNIRVKHLFLERYDSNWSSAVSIGAAISVMRLPPPAQVLNNSAIGIQRMTKPHARGDDWSGSSTAGVLFAKGWGQTAFVDEHVSTKPKSKGNRKLKFALVCDPTYMATRGPCDEDAPSEAIHIGCTDEVLSGPLATYDLGWDVLASELPPGDIKFGVHGADIDRLLENPECPDMASRDQIIILLSCSSVDQSGEEVSDHPCNKLWRLILQTDPASKFLVVDSAEEL